MPPSCKPLLHRRLWARISYSINVDAKAAQPLTPEA
jgi:hypothetical protein